MHVSSRHYHRWGTSCASTTGCAAGLFFNGSTVQLEASVWLLVSDFCCIAKFGFVGWFDLREPCVNAFDFGRPYFAWAVNMPLAVAGAWFGGSIDGTGNVVAAGAILDEVSENL